MSLSNEPNQETSQAQQPPAIITEQQAEPATETKVEAPVKKPARKASAKAAAPKAKKEPGKVNAAKKAAQKPSEPTETPAKPRKPKPAAPEAAKAPEPVAAAPAKSGKVIKTAAQHLKDISAQQALKAKEKREFLAAQAKQEAVEDLRDDLMSAIKNSGKSFESIHGEFGPHPSTLEKWAQKDVRSPRIGKMRAAGRTVGLDLGWIDYQGVAKNGGD